MISKRSSGAATIAMIQQEGSQDQRIADQCKYAQIFAGGSDAPDAHGGDRLKKAAPGKKKGT